MITNGVKTTGLVGNTYKALFRKHILRVKPKVVGIAVAYVSTSGFQIMEQILDEANVSKVRLVTDTKDGITHPRALQNAIESGWRVRIVDSLAGTFHPKLYVGASRFDEKSGVADLSLVITGSPNLSRSAFLRNGECVSWNIAPVKSKSAINAWYECWGVGVPANAKKIRAYEKYFASRNRHRSPDDLVTLGIADNISQRARGAPKPNAVPPRPEQKPISERVGSVAWAGLQSFTGAYTLQVEFPKEAGLVLRRIFRGTSQNDWVQILCADGEFRNFKFNYYEHNGMFRLNVPNSTPLVEWARKYKQGIACVELSEEQKELTFAILQPGQSMIDVVDRSLLLGTWGRTPTRLYGWY